MGLAWAALILAVLALLVYFGLRRGGTGPTSKSGFRPVPVTTCGNPPVHQEYAVDMTSRNAAGTVAWHPYSTQSRVSLDRFAESPENAEELNPVTGLGKTNMVRKMADRYRGGAALIGRSIYELQPGQPGFMEEVSDGALSMMAKFPLAAPPCSQTTPSSTAFGAPSCLLATSDVDSEYLTDGYYDNSVLLEALTSRRHPPPPNTLTASRTGLGSVRMDPRFEPGPQDRTPDGDASWAQGGAAGGPTSGAWASSTFFPPPSYDATYIHGFGDYNVFGRQYPVEAMCTGQSDW